MLCSVDGHDNMHLTQMRQAHISTWVMLDKIQYIYVVYFIDDLSFFKSSKSGVDHTELSR